MANPAGTNEAKDIKTYLCPCGEQFNSQRPISQIRCPKCGRRGESVLV